MYRLIKENFSGRIASVGKELPEVFITIPFDPANSDAQEFGRWLKEGNIPEPPDGGDPVTQAWIDQTIALLLPNG